MVSDPWKKIHLSLLRATAVLKNRTMQMVFENHETAKTKKSQNHPTSCFE